jgi:5-methylcytosine-specific restriction endonuclease McrA
LSAKCFNHARLPFDGVIALRDNFSLDHVTPFAKGGKNDMANINPVCRPCNLLKKTQLWPLRQPV